MCDYSDISNINNNITDARLEIIGMVYIPDMKTLEENLQKLGTTVPSLVNYTCKTGNHKLMDLLNFLSQTTYIYFGAGFVIACLNGHYDICDKILNPKKDIKDKLWRIGDAQMAIIDNMESFKKSDLYSVKYIIDNESVSFPDYYSLICSENPINMKFLIASGLVDPLYCLEFTIDNHKKLSEKIEEEILPISTKDIENIIKWKHIKSFEYLENKMSRVEGFYCACAFGDIDFVKWYTQKYPNQINNTQNYNINKALSTACFYKKDTMSYILISLGATYCHQCDGENHEELSFIPQDTDPYLISHQN